MCFLNIQNLTSENLNFNIINLLGELIFSGSVEKNSINKINLPLNRGMYFIHFNNPEQTKLKIEKD